MYDFFIILNVFFAWFGLKWAKQDFEKDNDIMGWLWIFVSAWNTATVLNMLF